MLLSIDETGRDEKGLDEAGILEAKRDK